MDWIPLPQANFLVILFCSSPFKVETYLKNEVVTHIKFHPLISTFQLLYVYETERQREKQMERPMYTAKMLVNSGGTKGLQEYLPFHFIFYILYCLQFFHRGTQLGIFAHRNVVSAVERIPLKINLMNQTPVLQLRFSFWNPKLQQTASDMERFVHSFQERC